MTEKVQSTSEPGQEPAPMSGSVAGQEPAADTQSVVSQEPKAEGELPVDIIRKELSEARQEAARYRTEVRELQQKLEQGKVSEAELGKLQESLASLEAALSEREMRLQETALDAVVARYCASNGIGDVEAVQALVRHSGYYDKLEFDDGVPKNADDVLEAIVSKRPYLRSPSISFSPTNPSQSAQPIRPKDMRDHSFYMEHKEEILGLLGAQVKNIPKRR